MILLVIALEVLAIAANFCVPAVQNMKRGSKADRIVREMLQIKAAGEAARAQRGEWPACGRPGTEPPAMGAFLPSGFDFQRDGYAFEWERWALSGPPVRDASTSAEPAASGTLLSGPSSREMAGITVITTDPRLAATVARRIAPGLTRLTLGNRTTLVVAGPGVSGS